MEYYLKIPKKVINTLDMYNTMIKRVRGQIY